MTDQHRAPRYSRPIPASRLERVTTPQPRHRPLGRRIVGAIVATVQAERDEPAFLAGGVMGLLLAAAFVASLVVTTAP